ncbi:MAG: hypothetical protein ABSE39_05615 [Candidatus Bathyarchaeia archaeon]
MTITSPNAPGGTRRRNPQSFMGAAIVGLVGLPKRASYVPAPFDSQQDSLSSCVEMKAQHEWR